MPHKISKELREIEMILDSSGYNPTRWSKNQLVFELEQHPVQVFYNNGEVTLNTKAARNTVSIIIQKREYADECYLHIHRVCQKLKSLLLAQRNK
jgi:hypothetical protein